MSSFFSFVLQKFVFSMKDRWESERSVPKLDSLSSLATEATLVSPEAEIVYQGIRLAKIINKSSECI